MLWLKAARRAQDWHIGDLAREARIPSHYISLIENGRLTRPTEGMLAKLSRALGVPAEDLLKEVDPDAMETKA